MRGLSSSAWAEDERPSSRENPAHALRHPSTFCPRRGKVIVVVAISLIAILGVAALSVDGGMLFDSRRKVQTAADAAALAAAVDLFTNFYTNGGLDSKGTAVTSAYTTAAACGFTSGNGNTIAVSVPPGSGPFAGVKGYAEVTITTTQAQYFSAIWGSGNQKITARAVARGFMS